MNQINVDFINNLKELNPNDRLKYIRKKILGLNQDEFCLDGIIRISTLKAIESGACKISAKMAAKLLYKLLINGVVCNDDIFFENSSAISIEIDPKARENNFALSQDIANFDRKIKKLRAIKITSNEFAPFIKTNSIIFIDVNNEINPENLNDSLCIVEGSTTKIFFLTYKKKQIHAILNEKNMVFSLDALKMCKVYPISIIFYE